MDTLTDNILDRNVGPLVEFDQNFGVAQYSALLDILVELDPEESNTFGNEDTYAKACEFYPETGERITVDLINCISDAVTDLDPDSFFGVDLSDGKLYWGIIR